MQSFIEIHNDTKQHNLSGKSIPEAAIKIPCHQPAQSRKSCRQPKPSQSHHTSQPLIHRIPRGTNHFVTKGAFSEHTLYIDSTSYPLGKSASGEKTRRHPPVVSWAEQESSHQSKCSKSHHTNQLPTTDAQWYILSKMPCANTS